MGQILKGHTIPVFLIILIWYFDLGVRDEYFAPLKGFLGSLNETERAVLVCHSFGGLAVSQAMVMFLTRIEVAVFVTALMPGPNLNISQSQSGAQVLFLIATTSTMTGRDKPPTTFMFGPWPVVPGQRCLSALANPGEPRVSVGLIMPNKCIHKMIGIVLRQDLTLAKSLIRPLRLFNDTDMSREIKLSEGRYRSVKRIFMVSEQDKLAKRELQDWMIERNPPDEVVVVRSYDHMVMMSKPRKDGLGQLL